MLTNGILNADLAAALARLRHTDHVVVADCGLPEPPGIPVVDLALVFGIPRFQQVLAALCAELTVEAAVLATEAHGTPVEDWVARELPKLHPEFVPHDGPGGFKELSSAAALVVRSGEATPYANVLLRCGVPF